VQYRNQVGGVVCWQAEQEGIIAPLDFGDDVAAQIEGCPFPNGRQGITEEIADVLDAIFASRPSTSIFKVDRTRLDESWEAWVYVTISRSPEFKTPGVPGLIYGFGATRGVLTWPNSD
jgi:hypothetical protein